MEKNEIKALIESLGIEYKAAFVPFSQSRNAKEKSLSINWLITLSKGKQLLTTDYMQGIAHLPNFSQRWFANNNAAYRDFLERCVESGKYSESSKFHDDYKASIANKNIPAPDVVDVVYSIVLDSDVIDYAAFEDWANDFGYDVDSRQAEKIYRACLEIALKWRSMIGDDNLQKLREAYQDY
jgi:hypothetical protein